MVVGFISINLLKTKNRLEKIKIKGKVNSDIKFAIDSNSYSKSEGSADLSFDGAGKWKTVSLTL